MLTYIDIFSGVKTEMNLQNLRLILLSVRVGSYNRPNAKAKSKDATEQMVKLVWLIESDFQRPQFILSCRFRRVNELICLCWVILKALAYVCICMLCMFLMFFKGM